VWLRKASSFPYSHRRTPLCHMALRGSPPQLHPPVLLTEVVSSRLTLRLQRESPSRTERSEIRREQYRACTVFSGFFGLSSVSSGYKKGAGLKCPFLAERGEYPRRLNAGVDPNRQRQKMSSPRSSDTEGARVSLGVKASSPLAKMSCFVRFCQVPEGVATQSGKPINAGTCIST
jgi:hypothetical protein